jgi:uncharacterized protein (DUF2062 family)
MANGVILIDLLGIAFFPMDIRIAIALFPGSGAEWTPAGIDAFRTRLPAGCFLLDGDGLDRRIEGAPAKFMGRHLRAAARCARDSDATHLLMWRGGNLPPAGDIQNLATACQENPEALIVGQRASRPAARLHQHLFGRVLPRFWLKMQTGRHLEDPFCAVRLYPLAVIENLPFYQRGTILGTEILVKSAWADVPFQEVPVATDAALHDGEPSSPGEPVWRFLLNIHYALRSVLPVPHRKLVSAAEKTGAKITVWRPMRSLRTLLRENTSPAQLALAAGVGVFLGTLPLIACHTLVIILTSNYFRLNKIAALASSQLCMPPVVPALCIETGYFLRHGRFLTEISMETLGYQALERLYEWLLGSLVLAPLLAVLIGGATLLMARIAARSMATVRSLGAGTP